jgi:Tol biopolymer transport system component
MVFRRVTACGAVWAVLFLLVSVMAAAPPPARAGNGLNAVELWSEQWCTTQDCFEDPLGVVVVRPDGGGARRMPFRARSEHGPGASLSPRFSPDGRLLAVQVESVGIAVGHPDASGFRYVYRADATYGSPAWSPWSNALVFAAYPETRGKLVEVSIETGRRRTLGSGEDPTWSPNGRWIAFTGASGVMITRPDGRGRRTLTHCADDCTVERWSADGRKVVYVDGAEGQWRAVNVATGRNVPVPAPRYGYLISPDWRLRATSDDRGVYVARRDGSDRRRILGSPQQWGAGSYAVGDWQHLP